MAGARWVGKGIRMHWLAAMLVALAVALPGYRMGAKIGVDYEVRHAPRTASGYIVGAEPRDLGPADAPRAALFVHGFVGGGNNFGDLPDRLAAQGWRVRVMCLPGHGIDPRDFEQCTPDELVSAVIAEADALRADHGAVMLVGHSMGGALCTLAAAQGKADALALGAPYFGVTHHWYYGLRAETWARVACPLLRWTYKGKALVQVNREEAKAQIMSYRWVPLRGAVTLAKIGRRASSPETLRRVTCPVLVIHSHGDVAASPEACTRAFEAIAAQQKQFVWADRSNHHVFVDYDREQVIAAIESFAKTVPSHGSAS